MAYGNSLANPLSDLVYCFWNFLPHIRCGEREDYGKKMQNISKGAWLVEENVPVTQSILADRKAVCAEFLKNVQGKEFDKILLFGIGSSYNAG